MIRGLSSFVLFVALISITISSEVNISANKSHIEMTKHKRILPSVKQLLINDSDSDCQRFLQVLDKMDPEDYTFVDDSPFTIIIPKINFNNSSLEENRIKELIFDHIIPGVQIVSLKSGERYKSMNYNEISIKNTSPAKWKVNGLNVLKFYNIPSKPISIVEIDGYLNDHKNSLNKRNIEEHNSFNDPEKLVQKEAHKSEIQQKESKTTYLKNYLSSMKSGTKVFQHFLANSNISQILEDTTSSYIILIPSDQAFQRWHPIDWGFYPFSVPEFTENILRNHVVQVHPKHSFNLKNGEKEQTLKTLGGDYVIFRNEPSPTVNNVTILSNTTLTNGNQIFIINEVLFMSESIVSSLHQQNKDKETPPLLAFPWFGSQFLSHAFLTLERDNRFTQITRFLSSAEIASSIVGSNYTFFVPYDEAFEKYGIDLLPDDVLSSESGIKLILNHFVKGRLYARDLRKDKVFETVGGKLLKITKDSTGQVEVNNARISESEIFVYNLGTMFYIDEVLFPELLQNELKEISKASNQNKVPESGEDYYTTEISFLDEKVSSKSNREPTTSEYRTLLSSLLTTRSDVELVPTDFSEIAQEFTENRRQETLRSIPPPKRK